MFVAPYARALIICLLALTFTACATDQQRDAIDLPSSTSPSDARRPTRFPDAGPTEADEDGRGIRVVVPSHCGVLSVTIEGELWLASPALGGHNHPAGWGEDETAGRFVKSSENRGTFYGDQGQSAEFRLAQPETADPNLGCE